MASASVLNRNDHAGEGATSTGGTGKTFPYKLYAMLEYSTNSSEFASVVSWTSDGTSFAIRNKDIMLESVIPLFFEKQSKYRSFVSCEG